MLANNSRYGLSRACGARPSACAGHCPKAAMRRGVVNATNLFDAAVGFGGYRESGFGREGGREGIHEYLT